MAKVEIKEIGEIKGQSEVKKVPNRSSLLSYVKPGAVLVFHGKEGNELVYEIFKPDPNGEKTLPPAKMAVTKFAGSIDKVDNAYATLLFWALKENKTIGTPIREVYLKVDTAQGEVEVEIQAPIS